MFYISVSLNATEDQESWQLVLLCTALPEEKDLVRERGEKIIPVLSFNQLL